MKPLSLALFALVIVGCSQEQSHNELLCRSAQIVFTQPDSVVRMLSPHYNDSTMTAADRALYGSPAPQRAQHCVRLADTCQQGLL